MNKDVLLRLLEIKEDTISQSEALLLAADANFNNIYEALCQEIANTPITRVIKDLFLRFGGIFK